MRIRKRFIFLPLLVALLAYLFYAVYNDVREQTIIDFNHQQMLLAKQTARSIEELLENYHDELNFLSGNNQIAEMTDQGRELMRDYFSSKSMKIKAITRVGPMGKIMFTVPFDKNAIGRDISYQDHIQRIMKTHKPVLSDVFMAVQNYRAIAYHVPVMKNNSFRGTLAILIPFDTITSTLLKNINPASGSDAWVISHKGIELYCSDSTHIGYHIYASHSGSIKTIAANMMAGYSGADTYPADAVPGYFDSQSVMHAVYHPINLHDTFWAICIASNENMILSTMTGFRNKLFLILALLLGVGTLYTYYYLKAWVLLKEESRRKRAEEALRDSEKRFRELADLLPQTVFETDREGLITFANRTAFKYFGYTDADFKKGLSAFQMLDPKDRKRGRANIEKILAGQPVSEYEYIALRKDGTTFPVLIYSNAIYSDNKPVGLRGLIIDISQQKQLEQQFQQAQKMEAVGQLAGGVAHDFNNLLTVISGYSSMLLLREDLDKAGKERLEQIKKAADKAESLTRQLLAFSRKQIAQPKVVDINKILKDSTTMLTRLIGEDISIELHLADHLPLILVDPHQIEQIMINLIVNARDAIQDNASEEAPKIISVETKNAGFDSEYAKNHPDCSEGPRVLLSVSDTGMGMEQEVLEKIFEPFFTTKEVGKGTGLGLSTVYGIVKQNKANIHVYSEPGQGTTFKIYWPLAEKQMEELNTGLSSHLYHGEETILLVEDDESVRKFACDSLQSMGYTVFNAKDAEQALTLLKADNFKPVLIITDLIMPGMDGQELSRRVKKSHPDLKVIFSSGYTDNHIMKSGFIEEGVHFIQKPYSISTLSAKVREVLDNQTVER